MAHLGVLGELELAGPSGPIELRALKLRQLLGALVVAPGEVRSSDWLVDAIWNGEPPSSADKLLQVYVSRLRKLLPEGVRIVTRGSGYALHADPDVIDAQRFERLARDGQHAMRAGASSAVADSLLRAALDLWRGRAYGQLADLAFAAAEAGRLEDLRLATLEDRIDADLLAGRHAHVLGEVCSHADAHPLRERPQAQAMLCLYRAGRHSEALDRFTRLRARLDGELGLQPGREVSELQRRILNHDSSLLAAPASAAVGALPAPSSPLIGRRHELDELGELIADGGARLIVLTGAGGSGKTRLAIEAAQRQTSRFVNGTAFAALAAVRDPRRVPGAIAQAVGLQDGSRVEAEQLLAFLAGLDLLLVIDNIEHLQPAAPLLVRMLESAPKLMIVATSRAVLHLSGEHVYPIRPLTPADATALFVQRARAAGGPPVIDDRARQAIERICERLDRLPLAIELAASRTRLLSAPELLTQLEPRLPWLTGGPRDLPARQQTMEAAIGWSHDLLDAPVRSELRGLSVFAAGCSFEAARAVCDSTIDGMTTLLDGNLLIRSATETGSRYWMLETVREFAGAQLDLAGEREAIAERHLHYFIELAEGCHLSAEAELSQDFDTANREQENLRAAIAWADSAGRTAEAARLKVALENFWVTHDPGEGCRLLGAVATDVDHLDARLRARVLRALGGARQTVGELGQAERDYRASRALFDELGDDKGRAILDYRLGVVAVDRGDIDSGAAQLQRSLATFRAIGSPRGEAQATGSLGTVARARGDTGTASRLFAQSAAMCERIGRHWWQARMLAEAAELWLDQDDLDASAGYALRLLELAARIGDRHRVSLGLSYLAEIRARRGELEHAGRILGALQHERVDPGAITRATGHLTRLAGGADPSFERGRRGVEAVPLSVVIDELLGDPLSATGDSSENTLA